jgi:hypothetical protein
MEWAVRLEKWSACLFEKKELCVREKVEREREREGGREGGRKGGREGETTRKQNACSICVYIQTEMTATVVYLKVSGMAQQLKKKILIL